MSTSIKLSNLSLDFKYNFSDSSLRKTLVGLFDKNKKRMPESKTIKVLDDISLDIHDGDRVGIVGLNGAGKTTLLRTIAGIYETDEGQVNINGKVTSFLSINNGSHPDLTGYETIKSQLLIMGVPFEQIDRLTPEIAAFSELGDFMNLQVKHYSSGMSMRLSFSIVTSIHPEILLMDEWLSTGDLKFIHKAEKKLSALVDKSKILLLTSHDLELIEKTCNKVLWLEKGKIREFDKTAKTLKAYQKSSE